MWLPRYWMIPLRDIIFLLQTWLAAHLPKDWPTSISTFLDKCCCEMALLLDSVTLSGDKSSKEKIFFNVQKGGNLYLEGSQPSLTTLGLHFSVALQLRSKMLNMIWLVLCAWLSVLLCLEGCTLWLVPAMLAMWKASLLRGQPGKPLCLVVKSLPPI